MRTALLFQDGNFVGREYFAHLVAADRMPDLLIAAGTMKPESVARERERTGGLWNPPSIPIHIEAHRFEHLGDPALWSLVRARSIDIAIQGGIGILRDEMIAAPALGFLNVHPGRLPQYRGNACPEWAILNGDEVWATAHLIDAGIDTGPIVTMARYDFDPHWTYAEFRSHLYAHCATVLVAALERIEATGAAGVAAVLRQQDEEKARYWPSLDDAARSRLAQCFASRRTSDTRKPERPGVVS